MGDDFWDRLDRGGECWLWTGQRPQRLWRGVKVDGRLWKVHRYAWHTSTGVQRALAKLVAEVTAGTVKVGSETMDALFDAWLAHLLWIGRSPNYITVARRKITRNLRPVMGKTLVRKVTVTFLDDVLAGLGCPRPTRRSPRPGHAQTAQAAALQRLHLRLEARDGPDQPGPQGRGASVPQAAIVEPTIEEVIALMEAAEAVPERRSKYGRPQHRPEMSTVVWLGAVIGVWEAELCALKLDDFDWTKRRARIDQSIYVDEEQRTGVHTKDTKGHKIRFVALDPVSIQVVSSSCDR